MLIFCAETAWSRWIKYRKIECAHSMYILSVHVQNNRLFFVLSHPKNTGRTAKIGYLLTLFACDFEISQPPEKNRSVAEKPWFTPLFCGRLLPFAVNVRVWVACTLTCPTIDSLVWTMVSNSLTSPTNAVSEVVSLSSGNCSIQVTTLSVRFYGGQVRLICALLRCCNECHNKCKDDGD